MWSSDLGLRSRLWLWRRRGSTLVGVVASVGRAVDLCAEAIGYTRAHDTPAAFTRPSIRLPQELRLVHHFRGLVLTKDWDTRFLPPILYREPKRSDPRVPQIQPKGNDSAKAVKFESSAHPEVEVTF